MWIERIHNSPTRDFVVMIIFIGGGAIDMA
jgi:hypothetical protein